MQCSRWNRKATGTQENRLNAGKEVKLSLLSGVCVIHQVERRGRCVTEKAGKKADKKWSTGSRC